MTLNTNKIKTEIEQFLSEKYNITIIYDNGSFKGGICRVNKDSKLVVNKKIPIEEKLSIIARTILESKLDYSELKPTAKSFIDQFK